MAYPQFAVYTECDFSATGLDYQYLANLTTHDFVPMYLQWVTDGKTLSYAEWPIENFLISPTIIKRYWLDTTSAQDYITFTNELFGNQGVVISQLSWSINPNTQ